MKVQLREDHTNRLLWKRTISAQLHAFGCFLCVVAAFVLLPKTIAYGTSHYIASIVFLFTGFLVFASSTIYHFIDDGFHASTKLQDFLNNLDHFSIYLFIAGTYTPFFLNSTEGEWQKILLYSIWIIAILGIVYTWLKPKLPQLLQKRAVYTLIFILMGLTMIVRMREIVSAITPTQLKFLMLGGTFYIGGAVVYATKKPKLFVDVFGFHELWHIAVLGGAISHFFMILSFYNS